MALSYSLSAYQAWQRCEQRYYYQYVRRLRPLYKEIAPQRGIILHDYLAGYYEGLKKGFAAEGAHIYGLARIKAHEAVVANAVSTLFFAGKEEEAKEYQEMMAETVRIAERYFIVRGREDAGRYTVEDVEMTLRFPLIAGVESVSVLDVITLDQDGRRVLWEHKTVGEAPSNKVRVRDLQTLLYTTALKHVLDRDVDYIRWNYLRTKTPSPPPLLKTGGLSRDKRLDTTWATYQEAIRENGFAEEAYGDVKERLEDKELERFYPRFEQEVIADPAILLRDYALEARRTLAARQLWKMGRSAPVRSIQYDCDRCPFYRLCEAAVTGGDEESIVPLFYREAA